MGIEDVLELFPTKQFQHESEYKPILDCLVDLKKKIGADKKGQKYRDLDLPTNQSLTINNILAHFIARFGMSCTPISCQQQNEPSFFEEVIIVVCLIRKFLNEKGYRLANTEGSSVANYPEYCSIKKNSIEVLTEGLEEFFFESYPCYLSNILRYLTLTKTQV